MNYVGLDEAIIDYVCEIEGSLKIASICRHFIPGGRGEPDVRRSARMCHHFFLAHRRRTRAQNEGEGLQRQAHYAAAGAARTVDIGARQGRRGHRVIQGNRPRKLAVTISARLILPDDGIVCFAPRTPDPCHDGPERNTSAFLPSSPSHAWRLVSPSAPLTWAWFGMLPKLISVANHRHRHCTLLLSALLATIRFGSCASDLGHSLSPREAMLALSVGQIVGTLTVQYFGQIAARSALLGPHVVFRRPPISCSRPTSALFAQRCRQRWP